MTSPVSQKYFLMNLVNITDSTPTSVITGVREGNQHRNRQASLRDKNFITNNMSYLKEKRVRVSKRFLI